MIYGSLAFWQSELSTLTQPMVKRRTQKRYSGYKWQNGICKNFIFSRCVRCLPFRCRFWIVIVSMVRCCAVWWSPLNNRRWFSLSVFLRFFSSRVHSSLTSHNISFVQANVFVFIPLSLPSSSCAKKEQQQQQQQNLGILFANNIHLHTLRWVSKAQHRRNGSSGQK